MRPLPSALLSFPILSTLIVCILIFSTLSFAAAPDRITGPIVAGQLIKLSAGVPLKAQPADDRGPVDSSLKLGYMTLLTVPSASQQKAINQLLSQQQDRRSPLYHKWLTPEQYADRFGLSPNDIQKLTAWLQSQGFTVVSVARGRNFVVFSGTAAQAESVFQTQIHNFNVNGEKHFANTTPISIPAALSGIVTGIRGLNNFRARSNAIHSKPNYTFPVSGGDVYLIAPGDITTMYDLQPLYTAGINGSGQKLAVIGETDVYLADLNDFRTGFDLPQISGCTFFTGTNVISACSAATFQYVVVKGQTDPGKPDSVQAHDLVEADIDLEWSAAVAQQALIIYVNAPDPTGTGVPDSMYYTIDQDLAPVMTMSYSFGCELGEAGTGNLTADEAEFAKANMEGITFLNSSGDNGAASCDPNSTDPNDVLATGGLAVTYPASSPSVTGVGGTMIPWTEYTSTDWNPPPNGTTGGSVAGYLTEQGWNDAEEWGAYCVANPSDTANCSDIGVTSWATAQAYYSIYGGGGGASNCVYINDNDICTGGEGQPTWQQNLVIQGQTTVAHTTPGVLPVRFLPDVSLLASLYWPGFIACIPVDEIETGSSDTASICANGIAASLSTYQVKFGGTSFASPMFAGIVTLLNQYLGNVGTGLGNINPTLYSLAATPANDFFHQLGSNTSTGSNGVYCDPGTPDVAGWPAALLCPSSGANAGFFGYAASNFDPTTNYNLVTGLGSVDAYNLAVAWKGSATPDFAIPATLTNPAAANPGQSTSTTMSISPVDGATFKNNVTYTLSGLPSGVTYSFNPTQIGAGGSAQSVTINIQTLGPFTGIAGAAVRSNDRPRLRSQNQRLWLPLSMPLAGMLLVGLAGRRLPRSYKIVGLCLALALAGLLVACGGSSSSSPPPPVITVTVSPQTVNTLYPSLAGAPVQQQQFAAAVSNTSSQTVTWAAGGVTGGNATFGTITTGGLYTAPATLPSPTAITITATSTATTTPGSATVNLLTPTPAGTYPITVTATEGATQHTATFTLTVN